MRDYPIRSLEFLEKSASTARVLNLFRIFKSHGHTRAWREQPLFQTAGLILLVAMIAAIALTLRERKDSKAIDPSIQVRVRAADRMQVVKMAPTQAAPAPAEASAEEKK